MLTRELLLVGLLVVLEGLHVVSNVQTVDVLAVDTSIELLGLLVVAWEAAVAVGDGKTTINSTLEGTEDAGTSGGANKTDIEVGAEGAALLLLQEQSMRTNVVDSTETSRTRVHMKKKTNTKPTPAVTKT